MSRTTNKVDNSTNRSSSKVSIIGELNQSSADDVYLDKFTQSGSSCLRSGQERVSYS